MANFTTHIAVGTVVSGAAATLTLAANVISYESLVAVTLAGVVGSVLPDIDLKESRPSRALFAGLAVFLSFCMLFTVASHYSIAEMWIVWLGTLALIRYPAHNLFNHFSYHRGIWHSLVAAAFFWFITAIIYHRLLGYHQGVAWLAGGFLFIGYLTHLILDEIYSVDVFDRRLKNSFGTALKLYDSKHLLDSGVVASACLLAYLVSPPAGDFVNGISSRQMWAELHQRLLPHEKWFGLWAPPHMTAATAPATSRDASGISTGSITSTQPPALPAFSAAAPASAADPAGARDENGAAATTAAPSIPPQ